MNEWQLEVLLANGYDFTYGGIIDSEGKYVSSVTIGEDTINSELSEKDWLEYKTSSEEAQQKASDPVENIEQFKNDPILNNISTSTSPKTKKSITNTFSLTTEPKDEAQLFNNSIYTYPVVLGLSIIIFLIIKRITR